MRQPERAPLSTPRITNSSDVWEFPIPGGLVLGFPGVEALFFLNTSAAFIWAEFRLGSDEVLIASRLAAGFGIPEEVARQDVADTLIGWTSLPLPQHFNFRLNGKHFRLILDTPELADEILPRLAHLSASPAPPDFTLRPTDQTLSAARALLLQETVRLANGPCDWLAMLHAGACANSSACIVFPAASGSGKTTLAATLMASGLSCHADDSVAVEKKTLLIPPMPFALTIREGSWPVVASRLPGFTDLPVLTRFGQQVRFLPPGPQGSPVPAVAFVFPTYDPVAETSVTPLETLDTLLHLKKAGFWVEHTPQSIRAFLDWVQSLPSYRVVYSDINAAVCFFARLLEC
jgi:hypothetical protein